MTKMCAWVIVTWTQVDWSHCFDDLHVDLTENKWLEVRLVLALITIDYMRLNITGGHTTQLGLLLFINSPSHSPHVCLCLKCFFVSLSAVCLSYLLQWLFFLFQSFKKHLSPAGLCMILSHHDITAEKRHCWYGSAKHHPSGSILKDDIKEMVHTVQSLWSDMCLHLSIFHHPKYTNREK